MQPDEMKALRKAAGMTQEELADALGMNRVTISGMERGEAPIEKRTEVATREVTATHGVHPFAVQEESGIFWLHSARRRHFGPKGTVDAFASWRHDPRFATHRDAVEYARSLFEAQIDQFAPEHWRP